MPSTPDPALAASCVLIRRFEGCELRAYPDPATGGEPITIGYGATFKGLTLGTVWTRAQAEDDLVRRVSTEFLPAVRAAIQVPLPDACVAACCSLAYNIGTRAFAGSSVVRRINAGAPKAAALSFLLWNKAAGKVNAGLVKRRGQERLEFLAGLAADAPAPRVG